MQVAFHLRLAELLSARLCHELVSPIGAIANGVEILEDEPEFVESASQLIGQSAAQAARRLQFYRVAYGSTHDLADKVARNATEELFLESKIDLEWSADFPPLAPGWGKLACNLLLSGSEALPRGGRIELLLRHTPNKGPFLAVIATGTGARINDPIPLLICGQGNEDDLSPRTVQAAFTRELAERLGLRLYLQNDVIDEIALSAMPY